MRGTVKQFTLPVKLQITISNVRSTYLEWLLADTPTRWWHDSADPAELSRGLDRGAIGMTTNPVLISAAFKKNRDVWRTAIDRTRERHLPAERYAEELMEIAVSKAAAQWLPLFDTREPWSGYVCAQVNPARAGDREGMIAMARRLNAWAPNIAVKLPATAAGLDVLEDCVAEGITTTATVSFTVPQVIAIAERHREGCLRARAHNIDPGNCFAVLMIGRLDDYLREVAHDGTIAIGEPAITQAGLAVAKRAYTLYQERDYQAVLLVAALRGAYHLTELAGAALVMSIHPSHQDAFLTDDFARDRRIDIPIAPDVIERLRQLPDFVRAYEPDGMKPGEFITYGLTQRTLGQFSEAWKDMENHA